MQYRTLADGQLEISAVCLGCWALVGGGTWGPQDHDDALAAIRTALDCGVNFLDTAENYGHGQNEQLIREALGDRRDQVVIASKVGSQHMAGAELTAACERSLANLGTDRIDLYYLHWPSRSVPFEQTVGALERLVAAGKVRHVAVSNFGAADLRAILPLTRPAADQLAYNLLFRAIEHEILPACRDAAVPVVCYSPLMQGLLTGKFATPRDVPDGRARSRHFAGDRPHARHGGPGCEAEAFAAIDAVRRVADEAAVDMAAMTLAWLLAQDGVGGVIVGARNAEQARRNAAAGDLALPPDVLARLAKVTDPLKQTLGPNADMWQTESRLR
jgi:aryl-alcohol dehydrogenase-like predicted oxidoreductase